MQIGNDHTSFLKIIKYHLILDVEICIVISIIFKLLSYQKGLFDLAIIIYIIQFKLSHNLIKYLIYKIPNN